MAWRISILASDGVISESGHTEPADNLAAHLLDVDLRIKASLLRVHVSPDSYAAVGLVSPIRRARDVVGSWNRIAAVLLFEQLGGMRNDPDMHAVIISKAPDLREALTDVFRLR